MTLCFLLKWWYGVSSVVITACFPLVMCEYSKFRIESNSYLLFDWIRNWRNYSRFSNTYLTVISRVIDTWFVCTLPATSCCTHLSVEPSAAPHVPTPPTPLSALTTHARTLSRACVRAPSASLDRDIWSRYNGGRQTQRTVSWAWTFCQHCYGFNFNTETCCI